MSTIAIDFGTTRTKVAYFESQINKPKIIEIGREVRSILPSIFYIPHRGEILVGDDAVDEAARDRKGVVRELKMEIDQRPPIRKNRRKVDRIELAAVLFCKIKSQCEKLKFHNGEITNCVLTIPPSFTTSPSKLDAITEAARLGGFDQIETIEEPIAAAKHWLSYGNSTSEYIFVCDIGGGTTDLALIKRIPDSIDFQLFSELPPLSIKIGGNDIDNGIFDQLDLDGIDTQEKDAFLLRIKQYKEYVCIYPNKNPKVTYRGRSITNLRDIIIHECDDFKNILKSDIEILAKKIRNINQLNLNNIPLLMVGGGMHIYGLKNSLQEIWPGKVIQWTDSEHATVLGAVIEGKIGKEQEDAEKYFKEAMHQWRVTLSNIDKFENITTTCSLINDVVSICNKSLQIVDRYPFSFNLRNVLLREKNLLEEIDKAKKAWKAERDSIKVIELCTTAIKFYQNEDLPIPALEFYDNNLINQTIFLQAEALYADKNYNDALNLLDKCLSKDKDFRPANLLRIKIYIDNVKRDHHFIDTSLANKLIEEIEKIQTYNDKHFCSLLNISIIRQDLINFKKYCYFLRNVPENCIISFDKFTTLANSISTIYKEKDINKIYYDGDFVTNIILLIAENLFSSKQFKKALSVLKYCLQRKTNLKSSYLLYLYTTLFCFKSGLLTSDKSSWINIDECIDKILSLKEDDWGNIHLDSSTEMLYIIKSYIQFNLSNTEESILIIKNLYKKASIEQPDKYLTIFIIYILLLDFNNNYLEIINVIEIELTKNILLFTKVKQLPHIIDFINDKISLMPEWNKKLSFHNNDELLDFLLKQWKRFNKYLGKTLDVNRVYRLNSVDNSEPWNYRNGKPFIAKPSFFLSMASMLGAINKESVQERCLKDFWTNFPNMSIEDVIKYKNTKQILSKKFIPKVDICYDYGVMSNWIKIKNRSMFALHDITINIYITYKDQSRKHIKKSLKILRKDEIFPPEHKNVQSSSSYSDWSDNVFPKPGLWGKKIKNITFTTTCLESSLLNNRINSYYKKA